tara:strand:+ start:581 stop:1222 length:642 start_codon:yes stop_codon:yes gene_type:complete
MCVKCGINSCGCNGKATSTVFSGDILYNGLDFDCPNHFSFTNGDSLTSIIDVLATEVCTTLTNGSPQGPVGDQGPIGDQGPQGAPGGAGLQYQYWTALPGTGTWAETPATTNLASYTAPTTGYYQVLSSLITQQEPIANGTLSLNVGPGITPQVQEIDVWNPDNITMPNVLVTLTINWRGLVNAGEQINLVGTIDAGSSAINNWGGGFLVNKE